MELERLKKRAEFLAAARGVSRAMPGLVVQARARGDEASARVGFTATRKIGNAVRRNRARRRLREVVRLTLDPLARRGFDYVIIARGGTSVRPFSALERDLRRALDGVHEGGANRTVGQRPRAGRRFSGRKR